MSLVGFNDPVHSNWKLEIVIEEAVISSGKGKKGKDKTAATKISDTIVLQVNSLLLGRHSDFFRYFKDVEICCAVSYMWVATYVHNSEYYCLDVCILIFRNILLLGGKSRDGQNLDQRRQ